MAHSRNILNFVPFKKHLFSILKLVYTPSESIYRHLYFKGKFRVNIEKNSSFLMFHHGFQLENEIFWQGVSGKYEGKSLEIWMKLAKTSKVIFDVGSNTGIYALSAAAVNNSAKVYAFEPVESIFKLLTLNVSLNDFSIQCVKKALSYENGKASVYNTSDKHDYIVSLERDRLKDQPNSELIELEKVSFCSFVEENNIDQVDLLKIDVEYHEFEVLRGMRDKLNSMRPDMLIEIVEEEIAEKIDKLLEGLGYLYFDINDYSRTITQLDKVKRSSTYNILICKESTALKIGLI